MGISTQRWREGAPPPIQLQAPEETSTRAVQAAAVRLSDSVVSPGENVSSACSFHSLMTNEAN